MFRIRRIFDDVLPIDRREIEQIQQILREQFPGAPERDWLTLPEKLRNPLKYKFRWLLFVADDMNGKVRGFALVAHEAELRFCYLDYIAAGRAVIGSGVGGALYERVRGECRELGACGLFFECLPDDPAQCENEQQYRQNLSRLRFYERFGARPIINTEYHLPVHPTDTGMPLLVFDDLGLGFTPRRDAARRMVRAILERKYAQLCPPDYVDRVVNSIRDDPIRLREPRYVKAREGAAVPPAAAIAPRERIVLVVHDSHHIHHVRERGYVEAPVRIQAILRAIEPTGMFRRIEARPFAESHTRAVHDGVFVDYLKKVCLGLNSDLSVYPYVFPIRNPARPPLDLAVRAGYYCIDTFTPLNRNAYLAAKGAVDCTLTAAEAILRGDRLAYALVRPPGHHAERRAFGGFCYFNNAAVAAQYLCKYGRVAILDIDYHHGNGQQVIFYERDDVLTVSIHGHPRFAYPYFSGFEEEKGEGHGAGFNLNIPLPEKVDGQRYREALARAVSRVRRYGPAFLIVALGLDPAQGDPTGSWSLRGKDFEENGRTIGEMRLPTLVVQEGGYRTRTLGTNARQFFVGLAQATFGGPGLIRRALPAPQRRVLPPPAPPGASPSENSK